MSAATLVPDDLPELMRVPLSPEQLAAATAPAEPSLIVAGAGSGKTTVMAARVVWLVGTGRVEAAGVLGLTFTNKAAAELLQRVRTALRRLPAAVAASCDDVVVSTYHSFAGRLLREFGLLLGVEPSAELMSPVRQRQLAMRVASARDVDPDLASGTPGDLAEALLLLDSQLADSDVAVADLIDFDSDLIASLGSRSDQQRTGERMLATAAARRQLAGLVARYRRAKRDHEVLDFADYVRLGADLARRHPDVGELLRRRHQIVLLDEYQDTSVAQRAMLQGLFAGGHPVTAVGDPCQAIYGWRGASPHNMDAFPEHFPRADGVPARIDSLATNRRSGSRILGLANTVAAELRAVHSGVVELQPDAANRAGHVECALLPTIADELAWVAERLRATGRPWRDMAVLARTNDVAQEAVVAMRAAGIPVTVHGRQALLALPEVRWVVWAMRAATDPGANDALVGLLMGPPWRIGQRDMALLARRAIELAGPARHASSDGADSIATPAPSGPVADLLTQLGADAQDGACLLDALHDPGWRRHPYSEQARTRFAEVSHLIRGWQVFADGSVPDLIRAIARDSGLAAELALGTASGAPGQPPDGAGLASLVDLGARFDDVEKGRTAADFLAWLQIAETIPDGPEAPGRPAADAVTVMTVHAAKGLEFAVVAVPGLVEGLFPSDRGRGLWPSTPGVLPTQLLAEPASEVVAGFPADPTYPRAGELAAFAAACRAGQRTEEVRLAYVAVTRAKEHLLLSGHQWGRTQAKPRTPSVFLRAAAESASGGAAVLDVWALPPDEGATNPMLAGATARRPHPSSFDWGPTARAVSAAAQALADGDGGRAGAAGGSIPDGPVAGAGRARVVARWDRQIATVRSERRAARGPVQVAVPPELSVSGWLAVRADPARFALDLVRPVPRPVGAAAAAGEEFHAWAASRDAQLALWDADDVIDPSLGDPAASRQDEWRRALEDSPFGPLQPIAVEHPVAIRIDGAVVRGRIDAVFVKDGLHWVVDWKTGSARGADPLQLALYRAAWAQLQGLAPDRVVGCFVFVTERRCAVYRRLPHGDGLRRIASGGTVALEPDDVLAWEV